MRGVRRLAQRQKFKVGYRQFRVCRGCGKRYENKHGLRRYCDTCKAYNDCKDGFDRFKPAVK